MTELNVLVLLLNALAGNGLFATLGVRMPRTMSIPLSVLIGMFLHTILLLFIEFTPFGIGPNSMVMTALLSVVVTHLRLKAVSTWYRELIRFTKPSLNMYDVVAIGGGCVVGYYVVWAGWYWPVTPFDAMAGIDLVARQTVTEGVINNQVFSDPSLRGLLSNQPYYAPFAMLMQVIYRILGYGFGQVWLGISAVMFSWFMWGALREIVHPFIANVLWLLMILTPELLGYTYLLQTDYINAAFMASGVVLLVLSLRSTNISASAASVVLFAAACWCRTETIALVGIGMFAMIPALKQSWGLPRALQFVGVTIAACLVTFVLWNVIIVQWWLPVAPSVTSEISFAEPGRLFGVIADTFSNVLADTGLWGWTFVLFVVFLVVSAVWKRSVGSMPMLLWIVAILLGLEIVGTVFTAAVVEQTLRRGMFKIVPLVFMFIALTPVMQLAGERLLMWERGR